MQKGNWIPLDKNLLTKLPRDRIFSEVEAAFSLSLDYDLNNEITVSGYSGRWGWSRKRVSKFLEDMGVEIIYQQKTKKYRNQRGHIGLHKRDIKGTYKEHKRLIDSKDVEGGGNIKGTYKEHKKNIKGSTTINPKSSILNPNPNIRGEKKEAFERWFKIYPERRGRKVGKKEAEAAFLKIKKQDWQDLKTATANYSNECNGLPKDADRFLRNDFWKDFLKPTEPHKAPRNGEQPKQRSVMEIMNAMEEDGLGIKLNFKD